MDEMLLTLDTSSRAGSIALARGGRLIGDWTWQGSGNHTDWLLPHVESLLRDAGVAATDLRGIGVVVGPGSFTGLRVGVATAKGLALAAGCPLIGLSSLALLAAGLPFARFPVCALLDARKGEVYAGLYGTQKGTVETLAPDRVLPPEELCESLTGEILFAGDGVAAYRTLIVRSLGSRAHFVPEAHHVPRACWGIPLVRDGLQLGQGVPPELLYLQYLRLSEAEVAWRKRASEGMIDG